MLPICIEAARIGIKKILLPKENAKEAAVVKNIEILPVESLKQVIRYLNEQYQPDNYTPYDQNEESKVQYCIAHEISKKLSNILTTF